MICILFFAGCFRGDCPDLFLLPPEAVKGGFFFFLHCSAMLFFANGAKVLGAFFRADSPIIFF
jgi:hypothetical protein